MGRVALGTSRNKRPAILADDESVALMAASLGAALAAPVLLAHGSDSLPRATELYLEDWKPRELLDLRGLGTRRAGDILLSRWPGRVHSVVIADLPARRIDRARRPARSQRDYSLAVHMAGALAGFLEAPLLSAGSGSAAMEMVRDVRPDRVLLVGAAARLHTALAEAGVETRVVATEDDLLGWIPAGSGSYAVLTHEEEGVLPGIAAAYRRAPVLHLPRPLVELSERWARVADLIHIEALDPSLTVEAIRVEAEDALRESVGLAEALPAAARTEAQAGVQRLEGLWSLIPDLPDDGEQALRWAEYLFIDGPLSYLPPLWNGLLDRWLGQLGLDVQTLAVVASTGLTRREGSERESGGFGLARGTVPLTFDVAAAHRRAVGRIDGLSLADGAALLARAVCPVERKAPSRAVLWSTTVEAVPDVLEQRALLARAFDRLEEAWFAGSATRGEWPPERVFGPGAGRVQPGTWSGLKRLLRRGVDLVAWTGHGGAVADVAGRQVPGVAKLTFPMPRRTYPTVTYSDPPGLQPYEETRWATGAAAAVNRVVTSAQVEEEVERLRSAVMYLGGCVVGSSEMPLVFGRLGAAAVLSYLTESGDESARFFTEILRGAVAGVPLGEAMRRAWALGIDHPVTGFNAHQMWLLGDPLVRLAP